MKVENKVNIIDIILFILYIILVISTLWINNERFNSIKDFQSQIKQLSSRIQQVESFRAGYLEGKKETAKELEDLGVIITVPKVR